MKPAQCMPQTHAYALALAYNVIMASTKSNYTKSMSAFCWGLPIFSYCSGEQRACLHNVAGPFWYLWGFHWLACVSYVSRLVIKALGHLWLTWGQTTSSTNLSPTLSWAKRLPTVSKKKNRNEMLPKNQDKTMRRMLMTCCFDYKVNSTKARVPLSTHSPSSHSAQCSWFRIRG